MSPRPREPRVNTVAVAVAVAVVPVSDPAPCRRRISVEFIAECRAQRPFFGEDLKSVDPRREDGNCHEGLWLPEMEGEREQQQCGGEIDRIACGAEDAGLDECAGCEIGRAHV